MRSIARISLGALAAAPLLACGPNMGPARNPRVEMTHLREQGEHSTDSEVVGQWALAEMIAPDGDGAYAASAFARLDEVVKDEKRRQAPPGMYASLARAVADEAHGRPRPAADAYVAVLHAAQTSRDDGTPLVAWFATHHLLGLRGSVSELFAQYRAPIEMMLDHPEHIGWRALADLEEWWALEISDKAESTGEAYDAMVTKRMGCSTSLRMAGPFGHGAPQDRHRAYPAEDPGPWPTSWAADPVRGSVPHVMNLERHRCLAASAEAMPEGIFYAETFFTTRGDRQLIIAVQGAVKVWVDDYPVLERDPGDWGSWQRFGAAVAVKEGRHRVLARVPGVLASVRVLSSDGSAAGVDTDANAEVPYALEAPTVLADPNPIASLVASPSSASPIQAFLAASAAHNEGLDDVAAVLMEPLVGATGAPVALVSAAEYAQGDPAMPDDVKQRNAKSYRTAALKKDSKLWAARMALSLEDAAQRGPAEAIDPIRKLAFEFKEQPEILEQLARVYARLGWHAERMHALAELASKFTDDLVALRMYLEALEEDGALADADKVAARITRLDPDAEVDLDRALTRQDWPAAIAELRRLGERRPDRKEITGRIADVLARSGDPRAAMQQLSKALAKQPLDSTARFRLADAAYAKGDASALRRALSESLQLGANGADLRAAIDLLEGATDLEPYRMDGRAVVREFEAWEKAGNRMDGNAARVLDYGATWVHPDGSSEFLEHEVQKLQSQEAINNESEIDPPPGLVLHLRVIKQDGTTLEPEIIAGKQKLTFPHLEVGDYIEVEHITPAAGDGQRGKHFSSPPWLFREPDKGYWRSEFVIVTPKEKEPLEIESRGAVGQVKTRDVGGSFVERRWRVDLSPPAPNEPDSAPQTEFLPSVRIGWGVSLSDTLARLVDAFVDDTPLDPRLHKLALEIVKGTSPKDTDERAKRLYRFAVEKIQDGKETDGRRVLLGRAGSAQAAFRHLLRQLGIQSEFAIVKNRLSTPPLGKMSEIEQYDGPILRLWTDQGARWMLVRDKFTPYGYVPAELRGQPAFRLVEGTPHDDVAASGAADAILYEGRADLHENGGATLDLALTFSGNRSLPWRKAFDEIPDARRIEFVERMIVARTFDGGHVHELKVENLDNVDAPLVLRMRLEVPELAKASGQNLALGSIFPQGLQALATLPERQTPLLRRQSWHAEVHFEVVVPEHLRMPVSLPAGEVKDSGCVVSVNDAVHGHSIQLTRLIDFPAGRIQPGDEYARYQSFAREADALYERETLLGR